MPVRLKDNLYEYQAYVQEVSQVKEGWVSLCEEYMEFTRETNMGEIEDEATQLPQKNLEHDEKHYSEYLEEVEHSEANNHIVADVELSNLKENSNGPGLDNIDPIVTAGENMDVHIPNAVNVEAPNTKERNRVLGLDIIDPLQVSKEAEMNKTLMKIQLNQTITPWKRELLW